MARIYRQKRRAEQQDETRRRIVEATVALHTTIGPSRTTILAIAERAGVERPTVYRHFPTTDELLTACSSHYRAHNPAPDPEPWRAIADPAARLRRALSELYAYYAAHESELWNILRDLEDEPAFRRFAAPDVSYHARVVAVLAVGWPRARQKRRLAAIGHATDFFAWRSLRRQGVDDATAVDLMVELVAGV
jgi:AcrR family transcriptional regulator